MRYVIGVIVLVFILFIGIILIVNRSDREPRQEGPRIIRLTDYADRDARAEYTIYGRVVGQEERRAIRISVNRTERYIEILEGYEERVQRRETFNNIETAYSEFIMTLARAGYARERGGAPEDDRGFCPLGNRFVYKLYENGREVFGHWNTSCSRDEGSFGGDTSLVRRLFQNQIPDYNAITRGIRL